MVVVAEAALPRAGFLPVQLRAILRRFSDSGTFPFTHTPLAGILSFFLPYGTGSFYAGNTGHGVRHLVFGGLTTIGFVVSTAVCIDVCSFDGGHGEEAFLAMAVFAAGWLTNWIWGTIVAVNDANQYNRRLGSTALYLGPAIKVLAPHHGVTTGSPGPVTPRVGIQLVRLTF